MSNYSDDDFCSADDGMDYIFATMGAIYGASFKRNWEGSDLEFVRDVWMQQLGRFATYKPTIDYALSRMKGEFPPSAITFRDYCNAGPAIPEKPQVLIEKQLTQYEKARLELRKAEALEKLKELRKHYGAKNVDEA
jgi:hypothetical protein